MNQVADKNGTTARGSSRLWTFRIISVLLPFVLLFLVECILRLADYGYPLNLFIEYEKDRRFWVMNPHVSKSYFTQDENATIGNQELFLKVKDRNTKRIFVLGESTTVGYPYLHNGSFHRWLQYRLMHTYPGISFEIINLSLTAVNSFTVRDMAEELSDYDPDAVLIYTGHNEYYGALGVGSTSFIAKSPAVVQFVIGMRRFRTVQFLHRVIRVFQNIINSPTTDQRENLMRRMASTLTIPLGSDDFERGINQFETNINETLKILNEHQIPVLISTIISNEKDLEPFVSDTTRGKVNAHTLYQDGLRAYKANDFAKAKRNFVQAKDHDLLRFRASSDINVQIRRLSQKYANVSLIDMERVAEDHSPHGIIGSEILLEHVHPNLLGYALLSDAFFTVLVGSVLKDLSSRQELDFHDLLRGMPITQVDSLKASLEIAILKEGWPFNEPMPEHYLKKNKTLEESLAGALVVQQITWGEAMNRLLKHYIDKGDQVRAFQVSKAMLLEQSYQLDLYVQSGKLAMNVGHLGEGVLYLQKAFELSPGLETAKLLIITLLKLDRAAEAVDYLAYATSAGSDDRSMQQLKVMVHRILALKSEFSANPESYVYANKIAEAYLEFANVDAAKKYVQMSLTMAPENPAAKLLQARVETITAGN